MKKLIAVVAAITLGVALSACSNNTPKETASPEASASPEVTVSASPSAPAKEEVKAKPAAIKYPAVKFDANGKPSITPVKGDAPTVFGVKTLLAGNGETVGANDTATVHYSGWLWDGKAFDSSWERGKVVDFSLNQVVPGFAAALKGKAVGSKVVAILPPKYGYGSQAVGPIPANSTLVFVVEIFDTKAPAQ